MQLPSKLEDWNIALRGLNWGCTLSCTDTYEICVNGFVALVGQKRSNINDLNFQDHRGSMPASGEPVAGRGGRQLWKGLIFKYLLVG